jgi:serine-type D-Ala-D-Ala carboxypeptidase/endopeptidase
MSVLTAPPRTVVALRRAGAEIEVAAGEGADPHAVFELGSITKAVTGLLLADAVVRGEVALDTTLDACLPGARPLKLGDLASHSAGLPRLAPGFLRRTWRWRSDPYARTTVDELIADLARTKLRSRGGYSNFGAALLGQALAARAGVPYERLVHERLLEPLGLDELWAQGGPPVAQPHDRRGRPVAPWTFGAYAPAGCLHGTARGALRLALACLQPPPELADAVALALTPRAGRFGLGWIGGAEL